MPTGVYTRSPSKLRTVVKEDTFPNVVIIRELEKDKYEHRRFVYSCKLCGKTATISLEALTKKGRRGCNCRSGGLTHTQSRKGKRTGEYGTWATMIQRCNNSQNPAYQDYGGRGIVVCGHWRKFENFYTSMGKKPSLKHTIDRIKNNGNYSCGKCGECVANDWPMNCRWATRKEQQRNRRNNKEIYFRGKTQCLADWSNELEMDYDMLRNRLRLGWLIDDVFTVPKGAKGNQYKSTRTTKSQ